MFDNKFEQAFTKDGTYLLGLGGVEVLTVQELECIGFSDPLKAYWTFHSEHQTLMANLHMMTSGGRIVGTNQK